MPIINLPLIKGQQVSTKADYRDFLPINFVPVAQPVANADGYFINHSGIEQIATIGGVSQGAIFNVPTDSMMRIAGGKLYRDNVQVGTIASANRVSMAYSSLTTAFTGGDGNGYYYNGSTITQFKNWQAGENPSGPTSYDLSGIIDVARNKGRYIWLCPPFFIVTDLSNEQRPDYIAPIYSAESDVDECVALTTWHDYVVVIGRNSTEFFRLTGDSSEIYVSQQSLVVPFGCIATHAKCLFADMVALLGSGRNQPPSINVITANGGEKLSTPEIDKILQQFSDTELQSTVLESVNYNGESVLYVHLPTETLAYLLTAKAWVRLRTGNGRWTPIDIRYNPKTGDTECGDKSNGRVGRYIMEMAQYGENQEGYLQTPLFKAGKASLYDLSLDSVSGFADKNMLLSISSTENGHTYSGEQTLNLSVKNEYTTIPLLTRVGGCRDKVGFRLRVVSGDTVNISGLTVRAENG